MGIEEAEKLAREHEAGHEDTFLPECKRCHECMESPEDDESSCAFCAVCMYEVADVLARALLVVLPVVKAAEEVNASFCTAAPTKREAKRQHYMEQGARLSRLRLVVDTMRAELGKEGK